MSFQNDPNDVRYHGMYRGIVVDNVDPESLGRVKVRIPKLVEPASDWAWPMGTLGGGRARGGFFVPPVGSLVAVFFNFGDIGDPNYLAGSWPGAATVPSGTDFGANSGKSVPTPIQTLASPGDAPLVRVIETDNWLIVMDDRPGKERLVIQDKPRDADGSVRVVAAGAGVPAEDAGQPDPLCAIEILGFRNGNGNSIAIKALASLQIEVDGLVNIVAPGGVQINGRSVLPLGKPI